MVCFELGCRVHIMNHHADMIWLRYGSWCSVWNFGDFTFPPSGLGFGVGNIPGLAGMDTSGEELETEIIYT